MPPRQNESRWVEVFLKGDFICKIKLINLNIVPPQLLKEIDVITEGILKAYIGKSVLKSVHAKELQKVHGKNVLCGKTPMHVFQFCCSKINLSVNSIFHVFYLFYFFTWQRKLSFTDSVLQTTIAVIRTGLCWSLEPRTQSTPPMGMTGTQFFELSASASPGLHGWEWCQEPKPGIQPKHYDMDHECLSCQVKCPFPFTDLCVLL